jgi:septal ring-binding cell division protein DamX
MMQSLSVTSPLVLIEQRSAHSSLQESLPRQHSELTSFFHQLSLLVQTLSESAMTYPDRRQTKLLANSLMGYTEQLAFGSMKFEMQHVDRLTLIEIITKSIYSLAALGALQRMDVEGALQSALADPTHPAINPDLDLTSYALPQFPYGDQNVG